MDSIAKIKERNAFQVSGFISELIEISMARTSLLMQYPSPAEDKGRFFMFATCFILIQRRRVVGRERNNRVQFININKHCVPTMSAK